MMQSPDKNFMAIQNLMYSKLKNMKGGHYVISRCAIIIMNHNSGS